MQYGVNNTGLDTTMTGGAALWNIHSYIYIYIYSTVDALTASCVSAFDIGIERT